MKIEEILAFLRGIKKNDDGTWTVPDSLNPGDAATFVQSRVRELSDESARYRTQYKSSRDSLQELQQQIDSLRELTDAEAGDAAGALKKAIKTQGDLQSKITDLEAQVAELEKVKGERDTLTQEVADLKKTDGERAEELKTLKTSYEEASSKLSGLEEKVMVQDVTSKGGLNQTILQHTILPGLKTANPEKAVGLSVKTEKVKGEDGTETEMAVTYVTIGSGDDAKTTKFDDIVSAQFADIANFVYTEASDASDAGSGESGSGGKPSTSGAPPARSTAKAPGTPPARTKDKPSALSGAVSKSTAIKTSALPAHVAAKVKRNS